jgi:hypothetical protein
MKRLFGIIAAGVLVATGLLLVPAAGPAAADDRRCAGTIGKRTIDDNIVVPRGQTCRLLGTRVEGNVIVRPNARLIVRGAYVDGNIQGEGQRRVVVRPLDGKRTVVKGNIQLKKGKNGGRLTRTRVDGDIQLFGNAGGKRFVVRGNVVDGNLQCKNNSPRPTGGNNRVDGNKEGQCRGL